MQQHGRPRDHCIQFSVCGSVGTWDTAGRVCTLWHHGPRRVAHRRSYQIILGRKCGVCMRSAHRVESGRGRPEVCLPGAYRDSMLCFSHTSSECLVPFSKVWLAPPRLSDLPVAGVSQRSLNIAINKTYPRRSCASCHVFCVLQQTRPWLWSKTWTGKARRGRRHASRPIQNKQRLKQNRCAMQGRGSVGNSPSRPSA